MAKTETMTLLETLTL